MACALLLGGCGGGPDESRPPLSFGNLEGTLATADQLETLERLHQAAVVPGDDPSMELEGPVGTPKIVNGVAYGEGFTGAVSVWGYNEDHDELRQICSGSMVTNTVVITAEHCLWAVPEHGTVEGRDPGSRILSTWTGSGWQAAYLTATLDLGNDVSLVALSNPLTVRSGGQLMSSGYMRQIAAPVHGAWSYVIAYGTQAAENAPSNVCATGTVGCPDDFRPQQTMSSFTVDSTDEATMVFKPWNSHDTGRQIIGPGDSGAATQKLVTGEPGSDPITGIVSMCCGDIPTAGGTAYGARVTVIDEL